MGFYGSNNPTTSVRALNNDKVLRIRLQSHQVHPTTLTIIQHVCSMKQNHTKYTQLNINKSTHSEMGPVWQNPVQRTVRTAHLSVLMTTQNSSDNFPSYLQTNIIAQMLSIEGEEDAVWTLGNRCPQWCELRVNLYITTKQYRWTTRYLVRRGQHVKRSRQMHKLWFSHMLIACLSWGNRWHQSLIFHLTLCTTKSSLLDNRKRRLHELANNFVVYKQATLKRTKSKWTAISAGGVSTLMQAVFHAELVSQSDTIGQWHGWFTPEFLQTVYT